jgi:hypothetical protein
MFVLENHTDATVYNNMCYILCTNEKSDNQGFMYVCIRGGPYRPLHCDPQWSITRDLTRLSTLNLFHSREK